MINYLLGGLQSPGTIISEENWNSFLATLNREDIGFLSYLGSSQQEADLRQCREVLSQHQDKKRFVHIGIGGSSLGPEMLISALAKNTNEFIFLNNIDPDDLSQKLDGLNAKECLFYIVTKSGGTAETLALMSIVLQMLEDQGISQANYANHLVFATDPEKGDLRKLSETWSIPTLNIPSNIGGRFSVLTPVGFLPALFAGIDIKSMINGAKKSSDQLVQNPSPLTEAALGIKELQEKNQINQTVLMPYSSKLRAFSFWFAQLWAESLGKEKNLNNKKVNFGFTPISSYGATDQHSLVQLFREGPNDKAYLMLKIENFVNTQYLTNKIDFKSFQALAPFTLNQLIEAEYEGTVKALDQANRPIAQISLPELNAENLGELILYFELLTVLTAELAAIDPFDQPGVEAGKILAKEWLAQHSN